MRLYKRKADFKWKDLNKKIFNTKSYLIIILLAFVLGFAFSDLIESSTFYKSAKNYLIKDKQKELPKLAKSLDELNINYLVNDGFDLDVKFKDWEKIKYLREIALGQKHIPIESQEKVSAKIRYAGETYKVKISLTGGVLDHIRNNKQWSLAVKVKGENTIMGMKKFALLVPDARGYLTDWIGHKMLQKRGVIGLRSNFIDVNINGEYHGVYYLEERFEKRLVESNQLREGIVFKLNLALPKDLVRKVRDTVNSDLNFKAELMPYDIEKLNVSPEKYDQLVNLRKLWAAFETNSIPIEQVFDLRKFASLFAISDLLNEKHGMSIHNTRFYYNPITSLIEPIAREWMTLNENKKFGTLYLEGEAKKENYFDNFYMRSNIYKKLYLNTEFKRLYLNEAEIISSFAFMDDLVEDNKEEIKNLVAKINKFNPEYKFPIKTLRKHQKLIKDKLFPANASIKLYFNKKQNDSISLFVENLTNLPNEINRMEYNGKTLSTKRFVIDAKQDVNNKLQEISLKINENIDFNGFNSDSLLVYYNVLGLNNATENYLSRDVFSKTIVFPKIMDLQDYSLLSLPNRKSNVSDFKFLRINENEKSIEFISNSCLINKDLIIPKGYSVIVKPDVKIDIINSSRIISYSPLKFRGTLKSPISVYSSDSTGQGIVVYNCKIKSDLEYVKFDGLSNISDKGWNLRGAVTFYESPIQIDNCLFANNLRGDDYLNIIRTTFSINNTVFNNTYADALDTDFSSGKISNTEFIDSGNDAIDVSGTDLALDNVKIINAEDKGLSGGENSNITSENIIISGCEIGVASKDNSTININNIQINSSKLAYCSFQKKPEYGPSVIISTNSELNDVQVDHLIETGSTLILNGETIIKKSNKVKQYLYGVDYGKKSN